MRHICLYALAPDRLFVLFASPFPSKRSRKGDFFSYLMTQDLLFEYSGRLSRLFDRESALSVSGLESLARAGIALYNLSVARPAGRACGERGGWLSRLRRLYSLCRSRYAVETDFPAKCRLAHTLQLLANEPFAADADRSGQCAALVDGFVGQEMAGRRDCTLPAWLWCIVYLHYPPAEEDAAEEDFRCFRGHLARWIDSLQGKDRWPGLPVAEAWGRIDLLNANACLFGDDAHRESLRVLYAYYRGQTPIGATADGERLRAMELLYRQASYLSASPCPVDVPAKQAVVQAMQDSLALLPESGDEWLYVCSFLVSAWCEALMEEDV